MRSCEERRAADRRRYWKNRGKRLVQQRLWRKKNKARRAAWMREARKKRPDIYNAIERRATAKARSRPDWPERRRGYVRTWAEKKGLGEVRRLNRERMRRAEWGPLLFVRKRLLELEKEIANAK